MTGQPGLTIRRSGSVPSSIQRLSRWRGGIYSGRNTSSPMPSLRVAPGSGCAPTEDYLPPGLRSCRVTRRGKEIVSAKAITKSLMPPILVELIRPQRHAKPYSSWKQAREAAGSYSDRMVNDFRAKRSAGRKVDGSALLGSVLNLVAQMATSQSGLVVTDLGGATGDLGEDFIAAFPGSKYFVVENETMVRLMQGRSSVEFTQNIPPSCDIFYTSSTLQYLEYPMDVLRLGLDTAKQFVVLVRNSFSDTDAYHVQVSPLFNNGIGPIPTGFKNADISYPHRTLKESEVMALAASKGFECVARLEEASGALFGSYGKQLVFRRRT
jgi:putative methyltransferase (TIGR04325 family)